MKDLVIPGHLLKRELTIIVCFIAAAWLLDVYAVLKYGGHWTELFTQVGFILTITAALYIIRLLLWAIFYTAKRIRARR